MFKVIDSKELNCELKPRLCKTNINKIATSCFAVEHTTFNKIVDIKLRTHDAFL